MTAPAVIFSPPDSLQVCCIAVVLPSSPVGAGDHESNGLGNVLRTSRGQLCSAVNSRNCWGAAEQLGMLFDIEQAEHVVSADGHHGVAFTGGW